MSPKSEPLPPDWVLLASWVAVVETGSVSQAAELLGISQAAVSQRIKFMELSLSTSLLDRSTRPAQPTAAGLRLFESAKDLLTRAGQMMESVRSVSRAKRMIVRIGCIDSFAATVGPLLIKALATSSHQIRLWSGIVPSLDHQMESRQLDLTVTTSNSPLAGISRSELMVERYFVVVPASFEISKFGTLSDLSRHLQFIRYSARSLIGQQVDDFLHSTGDALDRSFEFDATDPLLSLVANGMGFGLTTPLCLWQSRHFAQDIRIVPLSSFTRYGRRYPELTRTFFLCHRRGELGSLANEVRDLIRIAVKTQLCREICDKLGLERDAIKTAHNDD